MNWSKILISGLLGGVFALILGFLVYGVLLSDFFASFQGDAAGLMRGDDELLWIPLVLGHLAWGLMFAFILNYWASISTFLSGAKAGAILGFLIRATEDLINLGSTHTMNATGTIVSILVGTVVAGIVGGVIGWLLGKVGKKG